MKQEDLETIVFRIVDRKAFGEMMQHHMDQTPICGLIPIIVASGDCVTVPGEIASELTEIDPDRNVDMWDICKKACDYLEAR